MNSLADIARTAIPSTGVQFRRFAYGEAGVREFLRDVLAMANAPVEGARYIVVGAAFDGRGMRSFEDVAEADFRGKVDYAKLANEFIEPVIRLRYEAVNVGEHTVGVYEIADCQDRPYMLRIDHSETLRRGDAYVRANDKAIKMGRRQLKALFEKKFRESVFTDTIEVGFPGDIIHKDRRLGVCDLEQMPSAIAGSKLRELLRVKRKAHSRGSTTVLARLTYARLFGPDDPFENRSKKELENELRAVAEQYREDDAHFLYEEHGEPMQIVAFNQGDETITDASVSIVMPNQAGFHVASELPALKRNGHFVSRSDAEQTRYPSVKVTPGAVQVNAQIGDIPPGEQVDLFVTPLRVCVGSILRGRRFAMQYSLFARNLRSPAKGRLRLLFT